ncbi:MAG TPA: Hsp33 family molecular chaperone HslO [Methylophilaceae bacterium]|nr:Hsp33 family molecular chaperone HslO [Methylophilaceae bacterium]
MPTDKLHRFIFDNTPIRGNLVRLDQTFNTALQHQDCPPVLRKALGELMAASALLAATLKLQDGAIVLQIQGKGALKLLVVECTASLGMRATAKWSGDVSQESLPDLIGDGHFVITLDPKNGEQAYQGIVPLEGENIAEVLQNYMQRSEQIETRIWLACDEQVSAGMLLQKLPDLPEQDADAWPRTCYLADTVKPNELLTLPATTLLQRLFSEEDVRLFDPQAVQFHCSCSRSSVGNMLRMLGNEEVGSIIEELGNIEVHCDFCNKAYSFDQVDAEQLFTSEIIIPASKAKH